MDRRQFMSALGAATLAPLAPYGAAFAATDMREALLARVRERAARPYVDPARPLPPALRNLGYDAYRNIQFRAARSFWRGDPAGFELQGMHRGFIFPERVDLFAVEDGRSLPFAYSPDLFRFGALKLDPSGFGDLGFSGLRVLYRYPDALTAHELVVFQGASYFRAIGEGMQYGLSARGLAIRTGDRRGEEFPRFTEFHVERPAPGAEAIVIHAVLDSPSVAGLFTFRVRPGAFARMHVRATIFARTDIDHLGLAPLTSMYWFGPLGGPRADDFRPQVHDSDGLMLEVDGEHVWRPLANPARQQVSSFGGGVPRVFGLDQRSRRFADYQDLHARYERRPSARVEPGSPWPDGRVELVELPTNVEYWDNIVAYWRLARPLAAGAALDYAYDLVWRDGAPEGDGLLTVERSMSGHGGNGARRFVIDFRGAGGPVDPKVLTAAISASSGTVKGSAIIAHPEIPGVRLTFLLEPQDDLSELRAVLKRAGKAASETWLYRWTRR